MAAPGRVAPFGTAPNGAPVQAVALADGALSARILTWGATLQALWPARGARSVVLGAPTLDGYLGPMRYFGAVVGRVANRIANGRAEIDGHPMQLDRNFLGTHTLHGGREGTAQQNWRLEHAEPRSCRLALTLADGHMGFPGRLDIAATYRLAGDALELEIGAETDRPTLCNLAHHAYWTLDGAADARDHRLRVAADRYLPVDAELIPTGEVAEVAGTAFDFRTPRPVRAAGGVDHAFCLADTRRPATCAAELSGLETGRSLTVETTEPGLQVYDGARIDTGAVAGLAGVPYGPCAGIALEPQGWPDAPNRSHFPPVRLDPGERYHQRTRFVLG